MVCVWAHWHVHVHVCCTSVLEGHAIGWYVCAILHDTFNYCLGKVRYVIISQPVRSGLIEGQVSVSGIYCCVIG
jgi:hypothetical protein